MYYTKHTIFLNSIWSILLQVSLAHYMSYYKERWQIELFFKSIKQQLKIKSFVSTSKNALLSQLWVALITYLPLSYLKFKSRFAWSTYTLCSILPANLWSVMMFDIEGFIFPCCLGIWINRDNTLYLGHISENSRAWLQKANKTRLRHITQD